jgi:hypothetical protein
MLRKSNRNDRTKKIVYIDSALFAGDKARDVMVDEILKYGGKKCNIQFISEAIPGTGEMAGDLVSKFDIKIATLPLSKKDSTALFGSEKYASKQTDDFIYFGYKNKVEKVPIFKFDVATSESDVFINLIQSWTF